MNIERKPLAILRWAHLTFPKSKNIRIAKLEFLSVIVDIYMHYGKFTEQQRPLFNFLVAQILRRENTISKNDGHGPV